MEDSQTEVRTDIKKERCVNILTGKKSSQAKEVQKRGYPREKGGGGGGGLLAFLIKKQTGRGETLMTNSIRGENNIATT